MIEANTIPNTASQPQSLAAVPLFSAVFAELDRARTKFPTWPTDPLHALAVVQEEVGELQKAVLQLSYEPGKASPEDVRDEAVQVAAMAVRFLASLDEYRFGPGPQHRQKVGCAACDRGDFQLGHADGCAENDKLCREAGQKDAR